jgi:hypothetical protein
MQNTLTDGASTANHTKYERLLMSDATKIVETADTTRNAM